MTQVVAAWHFEPILPAPLLLALAVLCAAAVSLGVWRRARGSMFRAAAFATLLFWLAGPTLVRETREGLSDIALVVQDQSASMQTGNRTSLAAGAVHDLQQQAAHLPGLELRTVTLPSGGHDGTRFWATLGRALADIPSARLSGVLAVTDGQVHDAGTAPPGAPLHALLTARGEEWDRRVRVIEAPGYGIVGHTLDLRVVVEDLGPAGAGPPGLAHLSIQIDGGTPQTTDVAVGEPQTLPIPITRAGQILVKLATDPIPGEASPINNQAVVAINGVRDRLRVLLVSGEPNQGERTWRRLLKSDPAVDLVHFTILRPPDKDDTTPLNELALIAFPTRELFQDKLAGFDLIILDRFTDRGGSVLPHLYLRNIADYVRRGGALLLTVGPEFAGPRSLDQTPLGDVLPAHAPPDSVSSSDDGVLDGAFVPKITPLGARHPVTADLAGTEPWGPWYRAIAATDVAGQVLMSGPQGRPLLVLNHVDAGRTAMLLSDQIWLWSRGHLGGGPQAELLRRVAHWLMKEPELDEDSLSAHIADNRLIVDRRSVTDLATRTVTVTPPDGPARTIALSEAGRGHATTSLDATTAGIWQVADGTHTAYAALGQDDPLEFADLRATADRLRGAVAASGGGVAWLAAGTPELRRVADGEPAAGPGWVGLRRRGAHLVTGVSSIPLLPVWLALPLLLGLILAAWRREAS